MHTLADLDQNLVRTASYVDGKWQQSESKYPVINPATDEQIAEVSDASIELAEQAVVAAKKALPAWSALAPKARQTIMMKWFNLIMENKDTLGTLLTIEQGKCLPEGKGEIAYGAAYIEWFAEEGKRVYGDTILPPSQDKQIVVVKQPVGVVTAITPWNFPSAMMVRKAAAALAAGCTFVVRPSELTPLSALAIAELAEQAGIPAGVFNVVTSHDAVGVGKVLTQHPDVSKFSFTGSTRVGKLLSAQCADGVKKVTMELGGNAPFIVFDDADIDAAVKGAMGSKYRNAGQVCVCTNRFLIHNSVKAEFTEKFLAAVKELKLGNGQDADTRVSPMISTKAVAGVKQLVDGAIEQGATLLTGGNKDEQGEHFYQPTVLTDVTNDMTIARTEIFGPVSTIIGFDTEQEALQIANDTEYGLAAYFYSRDIGRVWRVSRGLDFGMVGANEGVISNVAAPFGGIKQSGSGREGSKYGLDDYLEIKYICMGGLG